MQKFTKKSVRARNNLDPQIINHNNHNVLENGFGVRTERIRSGSKSKPIRTKKNFLNLSLIKRKRK